MVYSATLGRGYSLPGPEISLRSRAFPSAVLGRDDDYRGCYTVHHAQMGSTTWMSRHGMRAGMLLGYVDCKANTRRSSSPPDFVIKIRQQQAQLRSSNPCSSSPTSYAEDDASMDDSAFEASMYHNGMRISLSSSSSSSSRAAMSSPTSPLSRPTPRVLFTPAKNSEILDNGQDEACRVTSCHMKMKSTLESFESKLASLTTSTATRAAAQDALTALVIRHARSFELDEDTNAKEVEEIREHLIDQLMKSRGRRGRKPRRLVDRVKELWPLLEDAAKESYEREMDMEFQTATKSQKRKCSNSPDDRQSLMNVKRHHSIVSELADLYQNRTNNIEFSNEDVMKNSIAARVSTLHQDFLESSDFPLEEDSKENIEMEKEKKGFSRLENEHFAKKVSRQKRHTAPRQAVTYKLPAEEEEKLSSVQGAPPKYISRANSFTEEDDLFLARSLLMLPEQGMSNMYSESSTLEEEDMQQDPYGNSIFQWLNDDESSRESSSVDLDAYVAQLWQELDLPMLESSEMKHKTTMA